MKNTVFLNMITGMFLITAFPLLSQTSTSGKFDSGKVLSELDVAVKIAESQSAMESMDYLKKWESLLSQSKIIRNAIDAFIKNAEVLKADFRKKAAKYKSTKPKYAKFYINKIAKLDDNIDDCTLIQEQLIDLEEKLSEKIKMIKSDPEVAELVKADDLMKKTDKAVKKAEHSELDQLFD